MKLSSITGRDNLSDLMEAVLTIQSRYYSIGRSLNLETTDLRTIRDKYPKESDAELALEDVLLLWLDKKYNVAKHGPPTWRMLVEAVDKRSGGNDHELAKEIASKHQTGRKLHTVATVSNQPLVKLCANLCTEWRA